MCVCMQTQTLEMLLPTLDSNIGIERYKEVCDLNVNGCDTYGMLVYTPLVLHMMCDLTSIDSYATRTRTMFVTVALFISLEIYNILFL